MARGGMPATVTDYNSDDGEEVTDTRKQANVALKRSRELHSPSLTPQASSTPTPIPSSSQQRTVVPPDVSSDSGYSSRTMATIASADSSKSFKSSTAGDQGSTAASDVHTITSSTCDREDNSSEIVYRDGKKYVLCRDPNCKKKHRAPKKKSAQSSVTASTTQTATARSQTAGASPTKTKKVQLPKEHESKRQTSPKREKKQPQQTEPARPSLRPRSASATASRPRSGQYGYPLAASGPPVAFFTRYPSNRGQTLVSRSPVERPLPQHRATEVSARQFKPDAVLGKAPPLIRQEGQNTVSARKVSDPEQLESETESEDVFSSDDQELDLRDQYERDLAAQQAAQDAQQRKRVAAAIRQQEERDRQAMPPPARPPPTLKYPSSSNTQSFSMRQVNGTPTIIQDILPLRSVLGPQSAPPLTREDVFLIQQNQLDAATVSRPGLGQKLHSQPVIGNDASYFAEAARQRRPNSFYSDSSMGPDWEPMQNHLVEQAHQIGVRHQHEALDRERLLQMQQRSNAGYDLRAGYVMTAPIYETDLTAGLRRLSMNGDPEAALRTEAMLRDASHHIDSRRETAPPIPGGILRRPSSKRSSHDSSSVSVPDGSVRNHRRESLSSAASNRRTESTVTRDSAVVDGLKVHLNPNLPYEIEIENHLIEIRPNGVGMELCVGGKRDSRYYGSNTSGRTSTTKSVASTNVTKRPSKKQPQKTARFEDETEQEKADDGPRRGKGLARRRAETSSSSAFEDSEVSRVRSRPRTVADGEKRAGSKRRG